MSIKTYLTFIAILLSLLSNSAAATIVIKGIDSDLAKTLQQHLPLNGANCTSPSWWLEKQITSQQAEITRLLEIEGYYHSEVTQKLGTKDDCWRLNITIESGPVALWHTLSIDLGELSTAAADLATPRAGDRFTHAHYEKFKADVVDLAKSSGWLKAKWITHKVTVDASHSPAQVDLELRLDSGQMFHISPITITNSGLEDEFIKNLVNMQDGITFSDEKLSQLYLRLQRSGYFQQITISPDWDNITDNTIPLTVDLTPARWRTTEVGAGFATDTGARARGNLTWHRLNRRGHQAELDGAWSQYSQEVSGSYRLPDMDAPADHWYEVESGYSNTDNDNYLTERHYLGISQSQQNDAGWLRSDFIKYESATWFAADQRGDSQNLLFGNSWKRVSSNSNERLLNGRSIQVDWRASSDALLSDINYLQFSGAYKRIHAFNQRWRILGRARTGWTLTSDITHLPPELRFYAGGDNSVRGFGLADIGEEIDGEVIGGRGLLELSAEFDYAIKPQWSAAVFVDSGSAFNNSPDFHTGAGIGARWYSPLGPMRIDIAHPVDQAGSWHLHLSLGVDL